MEDKGKSNKKNNNKKQKHQHPNDQTTRPTSSSSDIAFKPTSDVKGLKFGGQFIVKSFTIRRARPLELLKLLSFPPINKTTTTTTNTNNNNSSSSSKVAFPSTTSFLPTNFTILAHHAWHTLTLGLGTKKSKVVLFVFESESMKLSVDRIWPPEIPLGEVNKKLIRGLGSGCEMARFKFRKGCITFYVYAVRRTGNTGFSRADDLRTILQSVVALNDFLDHTAMLAMPNQRSINYCNTTPPVAMAH
ncbi:hypothetical protein ACOSQ2_032925 [Xanthoceras sorbifolium]|uniref:DUF7851 domain-containing protein n=1 Tax=Xanthoceras sorbifolium TaxID=99658 RepID=A0ABQ8H467_9ROSI|nr:hypothetical protein JRO89_XS14G0066400 [Xanthoceras sorbifolium]